MTLKAQILAVLEEAPATTPEVVAVTGLSLKHCCAVLRDLWLAGVLTRTQFNRAGLAPTFLYAIHR